MRGQLSKCDNSLKAVTLNKGASSSYWSKLIHHNTCHTEADKQAHRQAGRQTDKQTRLMNMSCWGRHVMPAVSGSAYLWIWHVHVVPELLAPTEELSLQWHTFIHSAWRQLTGELGQTLSRMLSEALLSLDANKIIVLFFKCVSSCCFSTVLGPIKALVSLDVVQD